MKMTIKLRAKDQYLIIEDSKLADYYKLSIDGKKENFEMPIELGEINKNDLKRVGRAT